MGRIIVIDGTSNAGKTTLCENIAGNIQNVAIVPGASAFAKQHKDKYPNIPAIPTDAESEIQNQKYFFALELDRLREANSLANQGKQVFLDRSVLEILSVAYSLEHTNGWSGVYTNAEGLYRRFTQIAKKLDVKMPDKYLWLQADYDEVIRRNRMRQIQRGQKLSEDSWVSEGLINKQIDFFYQISQTNGEEKFITIDTNKQNPQEVLNSACELLNLKEKEIKRDKDD